MSSNWALLCLAAAALEQAGLAAVAVAALPMALLM
jgi:hypothetical protein